MVGSANYDPYGSPEGAALPAPFGYTGELTDPATGSQYLRARWYRPGQGTLLGVDPALDSTGQPYSYANDNPTNGSDPSGQCWMENSNRTLLLWYLHIGGNRRCGEQERYSVFGGNLRSDHSYLLVGAAPAALDALAGSAAIAEALRIVARADLAAGDGVLLGVAAETGVAADAVASAAAAEEVALVTGETCAEVAGAAALGIGTGGVALVVVGAVGLFLVLAGVAVFTAHFDLGPQYPVAPQPVPIPDTQTQPSPTPTPVPTATPEKKTCLQEYPKNIRVNDPFLIRAGYTYRSKEAAINALKRQDPTVKPRANLPATTGPCGSETSSYEVGRHITVQYRNKKLYLGSIGTCPCCDDSSGTPQIVERAAIIN